MKILIVKLSSIGDIVHAMPALAAIRRQMPAARISWAVERRAADILRDNQMLESLIEIDTRALRRTKGALEKLRLAREQFAGLKHDSYNVAIDFQGLLKSALLTRLSGAAIRFGFAKAELREPASRFFYTNTIGSDGRASIFEKNLRLAQAALDLPVLPAPDDYEFPIFTDQNHRDEAARVVERIGSDFVILNPGGGWKTKLWDAARFGALADKIWQRFNLKSVATFGPGEEALAQAVLAAARTKRAIAAALSLKGYYELAKLSRLYVGGDTGPTHLAVAAKTKVVGLYGPTEWWRNGSPRQTDAAVERVDINCRENCFRRTCNNWICLDIEAETVFRKVEEVLNPTKSKRNLEIVKIA